MQTLIIGGRDAGKLQYLLELGYTHDDIGADFEKPVVYKLNELVKSLLQQGGDPLTHILTLEQLKTPKIIVCDEVGCGVVPMDNFERTYREAVGRICIELAKKADRVERVYCGIPTIIKG